MCVCVSCVCLRFGEQHWFNRDCVWAEEDYLLTGLLLGLALYNGVILDLRFPTVILCLLRH